MPAFDRDSPERAAPFQEPPRPRLLAFKATAEEEAQVRGAAAALGLVGPGRTGVSAVIRRALGYYLATAPELADWRVAGRPGPRGVR
jgi:hypothetical protein